MQADAIDIDNKSAKKIPNLGMFCPQPGNVSFPPWEGCVPLMGISNKKGLLGIIEQAFCFVVCFLASVFKAATTYELTHDAGGRYLLIADGDKVVQEL